MPSITYDKIKKKSKTVIEEKDLGVIFEVITRTTQYEKKERKFLSKHVAQNFPSSG